MGMIETRLDENGHMRAETHDRTADWEAAHFAKALREYFTAVYVGTPAKLELMNGMVEHHRILAIHDHCNTIRKTTDNNFEADSLDRFRMLIKDFFAKELTADCAIRDNG